MINNQPSTLTLSFDRQFACLCYEETDEKKVSKHKKDHVTKRDLLKKCEEWIDEQVDLLFEENQTAIAKLRKRENAILHLKAENNYDK